MSTEPIKVVICWMSEDGTFGTIAYCRPQPVVRVYEKDKYDERAGRDLPFFDDAAKAREHMRENIKSAGLCQVAVGQATRDLGFADEELDL